MQKQSEEPKLAQQFDEELAKWQTKIDQAKLQFNLGAKDAQEKMLPYLDQLEQKYYELKEQWEEFEGASSGARNDIEKGLSLSMKTMQQAFEKAKGHFSEKDEK